MVKTEAIAPKLRVGRVAGPQVDRRKTGLPVMAVQNVERLVFWRLSDVFQRGPAEESEPPRVIRIVAPRAVNRVAVVEFGAIDEHDA